MPLETASYINQLDAANPLGSDPIASGDDHIRLVKAAVKNTFPNITGPVTVTQDDLNQTMRKDGSTMTGPLVLSGAPTADLQAATKAYVDSTDSLLKAVTITGTGSLTGGGDLTANRTLDIVTGGVTNAKLANGAVDNAKMASGAAVANIGYTPVNPSAFTGGNQSLGSNGFQKLPGGLIIQWGNGQTIPGGGSVVIGFPTGFPNACLTVTLTGSTLSDVPVFVTDFNASNFTAATIANASYYNGATTQTARWIAIGY